MRFGELWFHLFKNRWNKRVCRSRGGMVWLTSYTTNSIRSPPPLLIDKLTQPIAFHFRPAGRDAIWRDMERWRIADRCTMWLHSSPIASTQFPLSMLYTVYGLHTALFSTLSVLLGSRRSNQMYTGLWRCQGSTEKQATTSMKTNPKEVSL